MNPLRAFTAAVERAIPSWPASFSECAVRFAELAASADLHKRISDELGVLAARPTYVPAVTASLHRWVIWVGGRGAKLMVVRLEADDEDDSDTFTDSASHRLIASCGAARVEGELYELGAETSLEVLAPDLELVPRGLRSLRRSEVLPLRARRDVFDLLPGPKPRYLLLFEGPRMFTQQWVYSRQTLRPVASVPADPHDLQLEAGVRLLRALGHTPAVPVLAELAKHEAHFVRWTAIRAAMGLDEEEGRRLLDAAASDPHPDVRAAAAQALRGFGS